MKCLKPFSRGLQEFGCGQCMPCRIDRRRLWTMRLLLESLIHGDSGVFTLTYSDDTIPIGGSLRASDLSAFIKRLRERIEPRKIRFFGVGEYGDDTNRPHYHVIIFGLSIFELSLVEEVWGKGICHAMELNRKTVQYTCGYVCKKLTNKNDVKLAGREPEFARMSRRPGIGGLNVPEIAKAGLRGGALDSAQEIRLDGKKFPLGRYLVRKVREEIGDADYLKQKAYLDYAQKTVQLFKEEKRAAHEIGLTPGQYHTVLREQKAANAVAKFKIFRKKGSI